jgi:hypothetical protein
MLLCIFLPASFPENIMQQSGHLQLITATGEAAPE